MKEVKVKLDLAIDGSGWDLSESNESRKAYVMSEPEDTYFGTGYILIVPLNEHESDVFDRNVIQQEGIAGLKVPNVNEVYLA